MSNIDKSVNRTVSSGSHGQCAVDKDINKLVERLNETDVFTHHDSGRNYVELAILRGIDLKVSE